MNPPGEHNEFQLYTLINKADIVKYIKLERIRRKVGLYVGERTDRDGNTKPITDWKPINLRRKNTTKTVNGVR